MMKTPHALKIPHTITQHDYKREDNYHWLKDENWQKFIDGDLSFNNPDIHIYLKAEEAYKNHIMQDYKDTEQKLYTEVLSRIKEDDETYPVKKGRYFYYSRLEKGKNYPILCRKYLTLDAKEDIYFDINKEASGRDLYMFGSSATNHAQTFFAYSFNLTGSLERTIKVRNTTSGNDFTWSFPNSTGSFLWIDDEHLYIVDKGDFSRGKNIYKINIHKGPNEKVLVFSKPDLYDNMYMTLAETTDRSYVHLYLDSGSSHIVYSSKKGRDKFDKFAQGDNDISFTIDHYHDEFFILTNIGNAHNFKVMKCPTSTDKWGTKNWEEFLGEKDRTCINSISFYSHFLILESKNNSKSLDEISIIDMDSGKMNTINMPDKAYILELYGDWDHNSTTVRLDYETPISPNKVLELDLNNNSLTELYVKDIPNFDTSLYILKREFATARDGEEIPITLVYKKGTKLNNNNKTLVYGYGSYGYGIQCSFSSKIFSLIDRGFIYAIAHIRGGDDKGNSWYLAGKMHKKMNTFYDFIDSCEFLIKKGYTSAGRITINGGSAGGLLVCAVTNLKPELFCSVIADVAFVDVINTISDENLPLTPPEWEEWGNPIENKKDYEYILQYSPYDNVQKKDYPHMLYNAGISDEQVTYWEPTKMVAKLREHKTDDNMLLLNMNMHAGHAGASKRYEWIEEIAFDYSFILKCFDIR